MWAAAVARVAPVGGAAELVAEDLAVAVVVVLAAASAAVAASAAAVPAVVGNRWVMISEQKRLLW